VADLFDVTSRVAVITGASSGLGAHFTEVLAQRGALVVAAARRIDRLEKLADEFSNVVAVGCDVTVDADRERLIETAREAGGRLDILVNNAGFGSNTPALEESLDAFDRVIDVNLRSSFGLSVLAARHMMRDGGGSIINVSSILGAVASAPLAQSAYGAAKGGLINLTRHLAGEWATSNVRVNAIAPGWFPSELTAEMFEDERARQWIQRNTPMKRVGRLDELDGVLLLLASEAGSFITGQTITVDGGWTAR
jgi:NAD(P)-dependent dehydrogenase (short-subunit alcohol dehydrogenase family)